MPRVRLPLQGHSRPGWRQAGGTSVLTVWYRGRSPGTTTPPVVTLLHTGARPLGPRLGHSPPAGPGVCQALSSALSCSCFKAESQDDQFPKQKSMYSACVLTKPHLTLTLFVCEKFYKGFPGSSAQLVKNRLQSRSPRFNSWVRTICWRRDRLPIPGFWPGASHGLCSPWGRKELDTAEQLSLFNNDFFYVKSFTKEDSND